MKSSIYRYLAVAGGVVLILWLVAPRNDSPTDQENKIFTPEKEIELFSGHPEPVLKQKNFHLYTDSAGETYFTSIGRYRDVIEIQPLNGDPYFTIRPDSFYAPDSSKRAINLLFCHKIVSWDSIFVLDKAGVNIYMCNRNGNITSVWTVTSTTCENGPFTLRGFLFSQPEVLSNAFYATYLSYPPSGLQSDIFSCNTIAKINLPPGGGNASVSSIFGPYSKVYTKPEVGYGVSGFIPSFTHMPDRPDKSFVLSFPKDHNLYRVNEDNTVETISARSKYINRIVPYSGNVRDMRYNEKYETEEPRYWQVMHDPYRDLYYRIVLHRQEYEDDIHVRQFHEKPWSIMVFDKNFRKLGEQTFLPKKFFPKDIFVGKEGLYVSNSTVKKAGKLRKTLSFTLFKVNPQAL